MKPEPLRDVGEARTVTIELRLSAEPDGRTRFELEHIARVDDKRWTEFGPGAAGVGWDLGLLALTLHLGTGEAVDPTEVDAWSVTDDGKQFVISSSTR